MISLRIVEFLPILKLDWVYGRLLLGLYQEMLCVDFSNSTTIIDHQLQAIAVSNDMQYSLLRNASDKTLLIIATERIAALSEILSTTFDILATFQG